MKSIFDKTTRDELIIRISSLNENSKAEWGKMTVSQMLTHCILWDDMVFERIQCKRSFLGLIFGQMALRSMVKNGKSLQRSTPTSPELKIMETPDAGFLSLQRRWIDSIGEYEQYSNPGFFHPFFGKMTKEQVGILAYKHIDHHLRQFNG
jgi:hypothetical protein